MHNLKRNACTIQPERMHNDLRSACTFPAAYAWYRKNMVPTVASLEKICTAFGITLSQLFSEGDSPVSLTESQKKLLEAWAKLTPDQQDAVFALLEKM